MKKFSLLFISMLSSILLLSQAPPANESVTVDQMLSNISTSGVTSGILYNRSAMFANLTNFNKTTDFCTANKILFMHHQKFV